MMLEIFGWAKTIGDDFVEILEGGGWCNDAIEVGTLTDRLGEDGKCLRN